MLLFILEAVVASSQVDANFGIPTHEDGRENGTTKSVLLSSYVLRIMFLILMALCSFPRPLVVSPKLKEEIRRTRRELAYSLEVLLVGSVVSTAVVSFKYVQCWVRSPKMAGRAWTLLT